MGEVNVLLCTQQWANAEADRDHSPPFLRENLSDWHVIKKEIHIALHFLYTMLAFHVHRWMYTLLDTAQIPSGVQDASKTLP